jgi:hypothetical protein
MLDHAVGLRRLRRREAMLDAEGGAQRVELVCASRCTLAQAKEAIRELLAVVRANGADAQRANALQVTKEAAGICHLGHVFHVDVDVAKLKGLEGAVFRSCCLGLHVAQAPHTVATQAAIQPQARVIRVQELAHHRQ